MCFAGRGFGGAGLILKLGKVLTLSAAFALAVPVAHAQTPVSVQTLTAPAPSLSLGASDANVTESPAELPRDTEPVTWLPVDDGMGDVPNDGKGGPLYGHAVTITDHFTAAEAPETAGASQNNSRPAGLFAASGAAMAVPEPSALALLTPAVLVAGIVSLRRGRI